MVDGKRSGLGWLEGFLSQSPRRMVEEVVDNGANFKDMMLDEEVPWYVKLVPVVAVAYLFKGKDFIPDETPIIGRFDDIAVAVLGYYLTQALLPPELAREYDGKLEKRRAARR